MGCGARARAGVGLVVCAMGAGLVATGAPAQPEPADAIVIDAVDAALLARPGAALRHALDSIADGETQRAEALLEAIAAAHPVIGDYADLERLRLHVLVGEVAEALALADAWSHPRSPLRTEVYRLAGRARADRGDELAARAAWDQALSASDERDERAQIRLELARSYLRSGLPEPASEQLVTVWTHSPLAPESEEVDRLLAQIESERGVVLRSADRWRRRGDAFFRARHNEEALACFDHALAQPGLSGAVARRARSQRAHTLFRLRRYTEAEQAFAGLPADADNRIQRQRARARAGDPLGAAAALEQLSGEVRGGQGEYARLIAALLFEGEGEEQRAVVLYRTLAGGAARTRYGAAALWRLGWDAYRNGQTAQALTYLERLAESEPDAVGRLRARYWSARAAEKAGREDSAREFGAIAREFPFSYYGWRARDRADQGPSPPPPYVFDAGHASLTDRELARPRILLEAGLVEATRRELDRLYGSVTGLADRLALAQLHAETGDYHRAQRLVVDAYDETLARGPVAGRLELWWHAWPAPYLEAVLAATQDRAGLEPELVYAIMREESGYRPEVRSVSGALGLLQLMPDTAERVAAREALVGFQVGDLFVPNVNIRLGAAYLHELLVRFAGRSSAAIGSYNAGPHRVAKWLETAGPEDDEWVEAIPYDETREYVKRVMRSMVAYRVLY